MKKLTDYERIIMPRGTGKLYFIKRYVLIPELIKALEKIKEDK